MTSRALNRSPSRDRLTPRRGSIIASLRGRAGRLAERLPLSGSDRDHVDDPAVSGLEIVPIGAVEVVSGRPPIGVIDLDFGDVAQVARHCKGNVRQGQPDILACPSQPPVPFGRNDSQRRGHAGDRVPSRQDVVHGIDRLIAMGGAGDERKPDSAIERVIDG